ncbi:MAG: hypothetical protein Q7J47_03255 [Azoarcus sp.]|nr:hypothetical protein [Azoarcus sp.]
MTIEERIEQIEENHRQLCIEHTALRFAFLALYPAKGMQKSQIDSAFTAAHEMADLAMREGETDDAFRQSVSESLELLNEAFGAA